MYPKKIASEYILNPILLNNRKIHIRMYLLITLYPKYSYHVFKMGRIMTSKKSYVANNYNDHDIHDTHITSTEKSYFFPQDRNLLDTPRKKNGISLENSKYIIKQMKKICKIISQIYEPQQGVYDETTTGYEVFGVDFMIDELYHVYLIEINDNVGFKKIEKYEKIKYDDFLKQYFEWMYDKVIKYVKYKV